MGLLGKLLRKPESSSDTLTAPVCSHRILIARWDNPEDMGHEERVTGYRCETCHEQFTAELGRELMNMA